MDQRKQAQLQWLQDPSKINGNYLNNKRSKASRHFRNKRREYMKDKINFIKHNMVWIDGVMRYQHYVKPVPKLMGIQRKSIKYILQTTTKPNAIMACFITNLHTPASQACVLHFSDPFIKPKNVTEHC
jgi:hypothetical protein